MPLAHRYSIWIEAEQWAPGQWTPADDNSDVVVTFDDGDRWVATFFTYRNIVSLSEKNTGTGENLGGRYLAATDMILVDEVTRPRIEEVVANLLANGGFHLIFSRADTRIYLCGLDELTEGLSDDQATGQMARLGAILSKLGYQLQSGEAPRFNELWAERSAPPATAAGVTATDFERQFLAWLHIAFGVLPVAHQGSGNAWWDFDYGPSTVAFAVIGRTGGPATDWRLRIEEGTPTAFLDRVTQHFTAGSAVRRRVSPGRIRMQFKASALERPFSDQADQT